MSIFAVNSILYTNIQVVILGSSNTESKAVSIVYFV